MTHPRSRIGGDAVARTVRAARPVIEGLEARLFMHAGHDHGETVEPQPTPGTNATTAPIRIDSGGSGFRDAAGRTWLSDRHFSGGTASTAAYAVGGTNDDALFYTRRWGAFQYNVPVANGTYSVKLSFADPVYTTAGKRKFNVLAEGKTVLSNFDIAASGGGKSAITRQFNVTVGDGTLGLAFAKVLENPIVSAVEIVPASTAPAPAGPAVTGLTLINAANDTVIGPLNYGDTLNLATLGSKLSVRANTSAAAVGSVTFTLDGQRIKLENSAPYAIAGDVVNGSSVDYLPWTPSVGTHTLTVTPYGGANATGAVGQAMTVQFTVTNSTPGPTPTPTPSPVPTSFTWKRAANSPVARAEGAGFAAGGRLYVFGGFTGESGFRTTNVEVNAYDPAANRWSRVADMPAAVTHAATAVDERTGTAWVGMFFQGNGLNSSRMVFKYDYVNNRWSRGPDLPEGRGAGAMAIVGRELHAWGGLDLNQKGRVEHWRLNLDNPGAGWVVDTPMPEDVNHHGGVSLGGKLYSIGGIHDKVENTSNKPTVRVYDPATRRWGRAADLPLGLGHIGPATFVAGNSIVIAGGQTNGTGERMITDVLRYDPAANRWSRLPGLPEVRKSSAAGFVGGKFVVAAGNINYSSYMTDVKWVSA